MIGFDAEAKAYIMETMKEDNVEFSEPFMDKVIDIAMKSEQEYLKKEGILTSDGEFADGEYDEDDAFDMMIDALTRTFEDADPEVLAELLECYIEYHDQYMQEKGMLEWV